MRTLIKGNGREAKRGDELSVHLTTIRYNGEHVESIWDKPFTFELGPKDVNPGFVRGLPGMRAGGRRELVVPTPLTSRFDISPNGNGPENGLVYVVDLLEVSPKHASSAESRKPKLLPVASGEEATARPKAKVIVPKGPPPEKLVVRDQIEGSGPAAEKGDELEVRYVVVRYTTGKLWSWDHNKPHTFKLGADTVLPGWEKGLVGMRVGGRRKLIVPPDFVWPDGGAPPGVGPEATLVYEVDLLSVH